MLDADRVAVVSDRREGVGVRLAVRTRVLGVFVFTEPIEVTVWEPPSRLEVRHGSVVRGTGTWVLLPAEGGTRFTWIEDVDLRVPAVGRAARGRVQAGARRPHGALGAAPARDRDRDGPGRGERLAVLAWSRGRGARRNRAERPAVAPATLRT